MKGGRFTNLPARLRETTEAMASSCTVDMGLWNAHSNAALDAALKIEALERDSADAAKDATIAAMAEALDQCEDYFDNRADAEYFTDSPTPVPNEEMMLLAVVRAALDASR